MDKPYYKSRLREKGQVTVPAEIRTTLGVKEGDDLVFAIDDHGRVQVSRALTIPPEQAWFWSERWQQMEREAQADIEAGRVVEYANVHAALAELDQLDSGDDAEG